jgi:hypothetical protein
VFGRIDTWSKLTEEATPRKEAGKRSSSFRIHSM